MAGTRPVRAVVFDFDGLILDTEMPIFAAWREVFEAHGCEPISIEQWGNEIGTVNGLDPLAMLRQRVGIDIDADVVAARRRERCAELLQLEVVLPGVERWLDDAVALGLAVGLASSSEVDWVRGHLERLGLADRFACLSCFGDGLPPKPAPDLYLAACDALGVAPAEAVAVEDSPNGVAAAKAAGLRCVAVPNALTRSLDTSAADVVVPSLADRPLAAVLADLGHPASSSAPPTATVPGALENG